LQSNLVVQILFEFVQIFCLDFLQNFDLQQEELPQSESKNQD